VFFFQINCRTVGPLISAGLVLFIILTGMKFTNQRTKLVLGFQLILLGSVSVLIHFPTFWVTRVASWTSLALSVLCPTLIPSEYLTVRLVSIFLGLATPFSFLGISYETLFLPSLFLVLLLILKMEVDGEEKRRSSLAEFMKQCNTDRNIKERGERVDVHRALRRAWFHVSRKI
jgi:hypothetical protein